MNYTITYPDTAQHAQAGEPGPPWSPASIIIVIKSNEIPKWKSISFNTRIQRRPTEFSANTLIYCNGRLHLGRPPRVEHMNHQDQKSLFTFKWGL